MVLAVALEFALPGVLAGVVAKLGACESGAIGSRHGWSFPCTPGVLPGVAGRALAGPAEAFVSDSVSDIVAQDVQPVAGPRVNRFSPQQRPTNAWCGSLRKADPLGRCLQYTSRMRDHRGPPDFRDATRGERLQRVIADAGVASRRHAEELIESGAVEVNGHLITELPAWVDPEVDRIKVNGRLLPRKERPVYVMLNKPARVLTTSEDEPGADRRTVVDLVDYPNIRLFPVGRLDYDTLGLLLMTNDGRIANLLTHPRYDVPKTYRATVKGRLTEEHAKEMERGIVLAERRDGNTVGVRRTGQVDIRVVFVEPDSTVLDVTIREGQNRQVRRMLAAVGHPVKKLERIAMGPLKLSGVPRGGWRELTRHEVRALKQAAREIEGVLKPKNKDTARSAKPSARTSSENKPAGNKLTGGKATASTSSSGPTSARKPSSGRKPAHGTTAGKRAPTKPGQSRRSDAGR